MSRLWRNSNNLCNNGAERTIVQGKSTTALTRGTRVQQVLHPYFCAREPRVVISCRIDKRLLQAMVTAVLVICGSSRPGQHHHLGHLLTNETDTTVTGCDYVVWLCPTFEHTCLPFASASLVHLAFGRYER